MHLNGVTGILVFFGSLHIWSVGVMGAQGGLMADNSGLSGRVII